MKHRDDFCFAGIWEAWIKPDSQTVKETFSILTTAANPLMARIHNTKQRMPVILSTDEMEDEWLQEGLLPDKIKLLVTAIDEKELEAVELKGGIGEVNLV